MQNKVEAVKQFREPSNVEEVRSFLGLVNYVGKFIPNLATVDEPLRRLTQKDFTFQWTEEQQKAFDDLKNWLTSDLVLGYYSLHHKTIVIADASR